MIIRFKEYQLSPTEFAAGRFDLTRDKDKTKKHVISACGTYKGRHVIGYGFTLETGIAKMAHCLLADNESIVDLRTLLTDIENLIVRFIKNLLK